MSGGGGGRNQWPEWRLAGSRSSLSSCRGRVIFGIWAPKFADAGCVRTRVDKERSSQEGLAGVLGD